jgi:predicted  nucleic acid-binding Zn-ribbon protein
MWDQIAPILTATGGLVAAIAATIVGIRQAKGTNGEHSDDRAAIAVTNFEKTSIRVDTLWEKIGDLIEEVSQLKEDKAMQQEQIDRLTNELADEKRRHGETQDKLDKLMEEHEKTLKLLAEKEDQLTKLIGEKK